MCPEKSNTEPGNSLEYKYDVEQLRQLGVGPQPGEKEVQGGLSHSP